MSKKPYYITTAITYTSGKPHIGNTYEIILADSIARYKRMEGYDVFFQTGTDEHGQKIELKAAEAGITPKEFVDNVSGVIKEIWDLMNTSYDKFIRTTDPDHEKQVQKIFKKLYDQGDIYKGYYEGLYCTPCESFFTESQLVDGKCPDCGRPVTPAKEEAYFFKMSKYAPRLIDYINTHPEFIQPVSRKNEMMNNFLLPGLQDLCVSRTSFKWGIPVDFDPKHIVYVWLDALTNYITGIGYDCDGNSTELFNKNWPADLHLIGKDIIRFHTIYWPIFLMSLDLPLPKQVFGHPWLLQGDGKMSKSKGTVVPPMHLIENHSADAVRYWAAKAKLGADTAFEEKMMQQGRKLVVKIYNASKFVFMIVGNSTSADYAKDITAAMDKSWLKKLADTVKSARQSFENYDYSLALDAIETRFWDFCDNYVEIVKKRAYSADNASAIATLKLSLDSFIKLLAPFCPFITEEVYQARPWKQNSEISVHKELWSSLNILETAAADNSLLYDTVSAVSTEIRKQKTIENKSQKNPVLNLTVKADEKTISCLKDNDADLLNVGNIVENGISYLPAQELNIENIVLDQNFVPEKKKAG